METNPPTKRAKDLANRLRTTDRQRLLDGYTFYAKLCAEPGKRPCSPHRKMLAAFIAELEYRGIEPPALPE